MIDLSILGYIDQLTKLLESGSMNNDPAVLKVIEELKAIKAKLDADSQTISEVITRLSNLLSVTGFDVTKEKTMAFRAKVQKQGQGGKQPRKWKAGDVINPSNPFAVTDDPNNPGHYKVWLTNAAGDLIDGNDKATFHGDSSDPATLTSTDEPPMGFAVQGVKQGSANVSGTVTLNDGSAGPFQGDVAFNVSPGGPTGFTVTPA